MTLELEEQHEDHDIGWPTSWGGIIGYCKDCLVEILKTPDEEIFE